MTKPDRRTRTFRVAKKLQAASRNKATPENAEYFFRNVLRYSRVMSGREPFKNLRQEELTHAN